jgi:hypothetical protein
MMTKDAKTQDNFLSWIFAGTESLMFVIHFCVWTCFVCLQVDGVSSLQFNGDELLSWLWWWNMFVATIGLALEWGMRIT